MFSIDEYLKRLKIPKVFPPALEFLNELHLAHLINIPYENFDIINKLPFSLDEEDLFEKIIINNRGGYCYELIILFKKLLVELGYNVDLLSARIFDETNGALGPEYDHSILIVTIENEEWLTDVGNSLWFNQPMKLNNNESQTQNYQTFKLSKIDDNRYALLEKKSLDETFQPQYYFQMTPRQGPDFTEMCHYKWTSPESKFTKEYICSRITENGRIKLKSSKLIIFENGVKNEKKINSKDEFNFYLEKYFGRRFIELVA